MDRARQVEMAYKLVCSQIGFLDSYALAKERLAVEVTVLYLGGTSVLIVGKPFWVCYSPREFLFFVVAFFFVSTLAAFYLRWQLGRRAFANYIELACTEVLAHWLVQPPYKRDLEPEPLTAPNQPEAASVLWPRSVVDVYKRRVKEGDRGLWNFKATLYIVMFLWALAAFYKLLNSWQGYLPVSFCLLKDVL